MSKKVARKVSRPTKEFIAARQRYKCANIPGLTLRRLENYECPLWARKKDKGIFDESGYDIDHIVEHSKSRDDSIKNLQALCKNCHSVKTRRFMLGVAYDDKNSTGDNDGNSEVIEENWREKMRIESETLYPQTRT